MKNKALDEMVAALSDEKRLELSKRGFFVMNADRSAVYCPQGVPLGRKSVKKRGDVRYCRKSACIDCGNPCFERSEKKRFREIDFSPRTYAKGDEESLKEHLSSLC